MNTSSDPMPAIDLLDVQHQQRDIAIDYLRASLIILVIFRLFPFGPSPRRGPTLARGRLAQTLGRMAKLRHCLILYLCVGNIRATPAFLPPAAPRLAQA